MTEAILILRSQIGTASYGLNKYLVKLYSHTKEI